jgi:hypothetical protein
VIAAATAARLAQLRDELTNQGGLIDPGRSVSFGDHCIFREAAQTASKWRLAPAIVDATGRLEKKTLTPASPQICLYR